MPIAFFGADGILESDGIFDTDSGFRVEGVFGYQQRHRFQRCSGFFEPRISLRRLLWRRCIFFPHRALKIMSEHNGCKKQSKKGTNEHVQYRL